MICIRFYTDSSCRISRVKLKHDYKITNYKSYNILSHSVYLAINLLHRHCDRFYYRGNFCLIPDSIKIPPLDNPTPSEMIWCGMYKEGYKIHMNNQFASYEQPVFRPVFN